MTTTRILKGIRKIRALVVGDIRLDRLCRYDPELAGPSRETGIPRTAVISTEVAPGAGGTVACHALDLGSAEVGVLGVVGSDARVTSWKARSPRAASRRSCWCAPTRRPTPGPG